MSATQRLKDAGRRLLWDYHARTGPEGENFLDEAWDTLVILDGCRYDTFERLNTIDGRLEHRYSLGSRTGEFLERTFDGRGADDVVYVTANPMYLVEEWCEATVDDAVHAVVDVWATDWDDELGTVLPAAMTEAALRARERYPDKRLLVHYVQPHYPFVGPLGRSLPGCGLNGKRRVTGEAGEDAPNVWDRLRYGELDRESVRRAYEENLELALPHVERLVAGLDGRTVVTADHGNQLGEFARPFPVRIYGHPPGLRTEELVKVPWLVVGEE